MPNVTPANTVSYAKGIKSLNSRIGQLCIEGVKTLVVPSRGVAFPYFMGKQLLYQDYRRAVGSDIIENSELYRMLIDEDSFDERWIPFTANTGITQYDRHQDELREHWYKVLKGSLLV